ncbi:hypothetical protein DFH06DRAFT_1342566 [Mycena polygramma]|nr:hypothetical protein DFH06DRAFT_1342566 [Mycena polygramma]
MAHPSDQPPPAGPRIIKKRRRAYVACLACRKRKVKCVTPTDDDDTPCTRCASRGQKCEFMGVPDGDEGPQPTGSTPPDTPPILLYPAPGSSSRASAPHDPGSSGPTVGSPGVGAQNYFRPGPYSGRPSASTYSSLADAVTDPQSIARPPPSTSMYPPARGHAPPSNPPFNPSRYAGSTSSQPYQPNYEHAYPNAGYPNAGFPYQYAQQAVSPCMCPPGQCVCGASFRHNETAAWKRQNDQGRGPW